MRSIGWHRQGRTLYTKRRLPADFARADTEEYHKKGGNNTNARSWHKHMYGESLEVCVFVSSMDGLD